MRYLALVFSGIMFATHCAASSHAQCEVTRPEGVGDQIVVFGGSEWARFRGLDILPRIYKHDLAAGTETLIYDHKQQINNVRRSSRNLIAFSYVDEDKAYIKILAPDGTFLHAVQLEDPVQQIAWSPDGSALVYLAAESSDGQAFRNVQVGMISADNWRHSKISEFGRDVTWAEFDNKIYILSLPLSVHKYDPASRELVETDYMNIQFSPDGKYYIQRDSPFSAVGKVFQREPHQKDEAVSAMADKLSFQHWVGNNLLMAYDYDSLHRLGAKTYLVDLDTRHVRRGNGYLIRQMAEQSVLEVLPDGSFSVSRIEDLKSVDVGQLPTVDYSRIME